MPKRSARYWERWGEFYMSKYTTGREALADLEKRVDALEARLNRLSADLLAETESRIETNLRLKAVEQSPLLNDQLKHEAVESLKNA